MKIFVTDSGVARALCGDAVWEDAHVVGYAHDADGCLTAAQGAVAGVIATLTNRDAVEAYFGLFIGSWETVASDTGAVLAFVSGAAAAPFAETARLVEREVARDVVCLLAEPTDVNQPINRTGLVMRARSHVRAAHAGLPNAVRAGFRAQDVEVIERELPYAKYFDVEDIVLRHKRFGGDVSDPMARAVLRTADAVTVLPYDPVSDRVVLVEQFRPGAFVRGDAHPWVLEPVAGRCDGDEPVETVAAREMEEEAGLTLLSLEAIGNYYPSPGCLSEYLYSFVGVVDLSDMNTGVHGLDAENEDIRTHFLSFDDAMTLIETGEADNGPLLLSLYWLAAHRTRLREAASAA